MSSRLAGTIDKPNGYLLISDLDDTLLGDEDALRGFREHYEQIHDVLSIAYASGRFAHSVKDSVESTLLPEPAAIIGGVGSEIRTYPNLELVQQWTEQICANWDAQRVRQVLADETDMELQPEEFQSDYKISYYLHDASRQRLDALVTKLRERGIGADYVYSSRRDLDFLPAGVDKGPAAAFLAKLWGYPADRVLVSGNSGNDASLFRQGFLGIVVANAHKELKSLHGPRTYLSPRERANGVLDGLRYWMDASARNIADIPAGAAKPSEHEFGIGYEKAVELLEACATPDGFLATPTDKANYRRIWGRDGCITGLAAILSGDHGLVECCRRTLLTLARYQGRHGEIPSNVDPTTERVSYGGTAGRVDADLWFVIACGAYWRKSQDEQFLQDVLDPLEKVRFVLGAWEFNDRGLLFVPPTGDWADEYVQHGYVLYDQLLYLQALRELSEMHRYLHKTEDHRLQDKIARLRHLIPANYWFVDGDELPDDVYHEVLYEKGRAAAGCRCGCADYWLPFFAPTGYGYRFDAFANVLVALLGVGDDVQNDAVDRFFDRIVPDDTKVVPAFYPVITPTDTAWDDLQMTFSYTFKNAPHEYHNGGLWPMVTGFYVASLAVQGKDDRARAYLEGVHRANSQVMDGGPWSFPEYLHGETHKPGGSSKMAWSAAAAIIGAQHIAGKRVFEA